MSGKKNTMLWMLGVLLCTTACDPNRLYDESISIPESGWSKNDVMQFQIEVPDTTIAYNFYLNLRNNTDYNYSNVYLFLNTNFPDSLRARDTLQIIVADHKGEWLGKGFGRIKDQQVQLRSNMTFPKQGLYTFEIQHGMRNDTLTGIEDVGLRIENVVSE